MSTFERQLELEQDMMDLGYEQFTSSIDTENEFESNYIQRVVKEMFEPFCAAIRVQINKEVEQYVRGHKPALMKLSTLEARDAKKKDGPNAIVEKCAFLVIRHIFTKLRHEPLKMTSTSVMIGTQINSQLVGEKLSLNESVRVAAILVQLLCLNFDYLVKLEHDYFDRESKNKEYLIKPTEEFLKFCSEEVERLAELNNIIFPMIYKPAYWDATGNGGGFYSKPLKVNAIKKRNVGEDAKINANIARGMNAIQSTPWSVNLDVLSLFEKFGDDGPSTLKKAYPAEVGEDDQMPHPDVKYADMSEEQKKEHRKWSRKVRLNKKKRQGRESNTLSRCSAVKQAQQFRLHKEIFFPHDLDSRMRIYNKCMTGLNTQGSDHQKGLIKFRKSQVKTLEGARWMMINIANLVGHDKLKLDDRVAWTIANEQLLRDVVKDPIKCTLWHGWDKPFQGYAAAKEYVTWLDNPEAFINTHVQLDGLCNGVQNLAAITRDHIVAPHVGLVKTVERGDVYGYVCNSVIDHLKGMDLPISREWLSSGLLDRKITKTPVMTRSYGAKLYGIKEGVNEFIIENEMEDHFSDTFKAGNWMGEVIWDSMSDSLRGPMAFMEWVQTCAGIIASVNLPLIWDNPAGMQCIQSPKVMKPKRVEVRLNGKLTTYQMITPTNKINSSKMMSGSSPNIIHSCDASHLSITTNRCEDHGIEDFAMVHDSFGCKPDDAPILLREAKEAWVDIYSQNWPEKWYQQWVAYLRENGFYEAAAELPHYTDFFEMGDLDAKSVRDSDFFFA
jgi:DNA-directed RNA polymerase